ncbi:MAG: methyltransferase [Desulfurococcales archaeon]|nr:methyltransferase [Desulfurococcales archaeon]
MASGGWRVLETPAGPVRVYIDPCVYEPAEDSMLAIEAALDLARSIGVKPRLLLDAGSGSGVIGAALAGFFDSITVAVDINPRAVLASSRTLGSRGVALRCYWASCLWGDFDLGVLNPPYLPVRDVDRECPYLPLAWGAEPVELERACRSVSRVSRGVVVVYSSLSGWSPIPCLERLGFEVIVSREESFFMERLRAVGAWRFSGDG